MNPVRTATLLDRSDAIATYGMLVAGVAHIGLTPIFKPARDEDALWFAGTGLGLCFLSTLNVVRRGTAPSPSARWWCRGANVAGTGYMLLLARVLRAPHVYLVTAFVSIATLSSMRSFGLRREGEGSNGEDGGARRQQEALDAN